ncbi:MAG: glycosyltransferase [Pseudomonadota bacterium]
MNLVRSPGNAEHPAVGTAAPDLSIIIPVGPGDAAWRGLIEQLAGLAPRPQVVLVFAEGDVQSSAAPVDCVVRSAPAGRAHQLNAGITAAEGEWLWLLHADSRLHDETWLALRVHLADAPSGIGWFRLAFTDDGPWPMALNALGANLRARWLGLPFGDQGFVLHRHDAARLGPFDPGLACGEDHAMVWHARRLGLPLRPIDAALSTSARKYAEHGWLRTTLRHLWLTAAQSHRESRRA